MTTRVCEDCEQDRADVAAGVYCGGAVRDHRSVCLACSVRRETLFDLMAEPSPHAGEPLALLRKAVRQQSS